MYSIQKTDYFDKWLTKLKDTKGKVSILRRIERLKKGNFGDHKSIGQDLWELRVTIGAGYRVYYTKRDNEIVVLLFGGDKSTQSKDIIKAKEILKEIDNEPSE